MSNDILLQVINAVDYWIWCKDTNGIYRFANKSFCDDTGIDCEFVVGKTDFDLWPDFAQHFFNRDQEVIRSKKPIKVKEFTPGTYAERRYVETVKFPIFDDDGNVIATCGIARDIQWEHDLEQYVQQAVQELESIMQEGR